MTQRSERKGLNIMSLYTKLIVHINNLRQRINNICKMRAMQLRSFRRKLNFLCLFLSLPASISFTMIYCTVFVVQTVCTFGTIMSLIARRKSIKNYLSFPLNHTAYYDVSFRCVITYSMV